MIKKISFAVVLAALLTFLYWYGFIALEELPMEQREILKAYDYQPKENLEMTMTETDPNVFSFTYESFDGEVVYGQISYPDDESEKYPVLIGISAMGRNDYIWPVEFTIVERLYKTRKSAFPEMAESARSGDQVVREWPAI